MVSVSLLNDQRTSSVAMCIKHSINFTIHDVECLLAKALMETIFIPVSNGLRAFEFICDFTALWFRFVDDIPMHFVGHIL